MKTLYLTLIALMASCTVSAQLNLGVKAGVGTGNMKIDNAYFEGVLNGDNIVSTHAGLFLQYDFDGIFIRPEALYMFSSGMVGNQESYQVDIHRLKFPIMGGFRFVGPLYLEAGPYYDRILEFDGSYPSDIDFRENGFGYRIGPSLQFEKLMLFANYEGLILTTGSGNEYKEPYRINLGAGIRF